MMAKQKIALIVSVVFLVIAVRLAHLQLFRGDELRRLSDENRLRIIRIPAPRGIIYDRNGHPLVENKPYYSAIVRAKTLSAEQLRGISALLNLPEDEILRKLSLGTSIEGVRLKEGLTFQEVAEIEARLSDFPSLGIAVDVTRNYILNDIAAHVIGYLGKPTPEQTKSPEFYDTPTNAFIGQWGVEKAYDRVLRGVPGEKIIEVDALGRQLRIVAESEPIKGQDLRLSIDIKLQTEGERAFGDRAGALVALKPDTGEVLALVSRPSFDPNLFANGIDPEEWATLQGGNFPMLNRALQSQYPPGSVFKIVTGIAALEAGAIEPETSVSCSGGLYLGSHRFGCWRKGGHGSLSFNDALAQSCDVYFYTAGRRAGINKVAETARMLGIGSTSGLNLIKEKTGFMPDENWKMQKKKEAWYTGETYMASIGQGYVLLTPMQAARLISAVANGGFIYNATLIPPESPPSPVARAKISEQTLSAVRAALRDVVNRPGGTAYASRSKYVEIAGKTGTAQVVSTGKTALGKHGDHAWFVAYAPYEKPEVALAVLVEHGGHGGSAAAPIARRAIEAFMAKSAVPSEEGPVQEVLTDGD